MADIIIGVLGIAFLFAYIYGKLPEDNKWLRVFFLILSLFMTFFLTWFMVSYEGIKTTQFYDETGSFIGNQTTTETISDQLKGGLQGVLKISIWVIFLPFAIILIFFGIDFYRDIKKKKDIKKGKIPF